MQNETDFDSVRAWSSLAVVIMGTFLSMISSTTIGVALPTIMNVFGATLDTAQWITTAYALTMAIVIPVAPYLSKVFSGERVYLAALAIFTIFSTLCAFSWSLDAMLFFRIMQAIGGGMMSPIGMGMVLSLFPANKRGAAFGVFGIAAMAAPAFGPTLGGYIVQFFGWRYIFYVNLPFGLISVFLALKYFKFGKRIPFPKFDLLGFISAAIASGLILYLLGKNQQLDWNNPLYTYMVIIGIGAFVFFVVNELTCESPLLDLRILTNRNYGVSTVLTIVQSLMMMSISYTLPIFLQNFKGLTAMQSGEVLLPSSLVMALIMPIVGRITDIAGIRGTKLIVGLGIAISSVATIYISFFMNVDASVTAIIVISSIRNIGFGISMMPARTLGLTDIKQADSQSATAMSTFIMQFSSSISVAIMTLMISSRVNSNYANATAQLTPFNVPFNEAVKNLTANFINSGLSAAEASSQALSMILKNIYTDNYVLAIQHSVFVTAFVGILAVFLVPLFKQKESSATEN